MSLSLIVVCLVGLVVLAGLIGGIILVIRSSQRDTVSTARADWMKQGSEPDEE
ncbi:MAG: hypothetical protein JW953_08690 [Anaerolineae bacterium]|nr:hypothetical protein [Anaerolineae bacterium]